MLRYFLITFALTVFSRILSAQNASFYKEHITFKIEEGYFYVNGEYFLRSNNHSGNSIALFYPFPTDTIYSPVDSLLIYDANNSKEISNYNMKNTGVSFHLELDSLTTVFISYRQKLKGSQARYILTTTKQWGKPFEEVTYELIAPADLKISSFSYPPDNQQKIENNMIYYWRKVNFMPARDMIFTFEY
jgi:hypothetical protein